MYNPSTHTLQQLTPTALNCADGLWIDQVWLLSSFDRFSYVNKCKLLYSNQPICAEYWYFVRVGALSRNDSSLEYKCHTGAATADWTYFDRHWIYVISWRFHTGICDIYLLFYTYMPIIMYLILLNVLIIRAQTRNNWYLHITRRIQLTFFLSLPLLTLLKVCVAIGWLTRTNNHNFCSLLYFVAVVCFYTPGSTAVLVDGLHNPTSVRFGSGSPGFPVTSLFVSQGSGISAGISSGSLLRIDF